MSTTASTSERLAALTDRGTAVWLDQIRRNLITGGELQRLVDECSLRGVTSNPSIFEKAILGSTDYDEELERLAREGLEARAIYERIAIADVQGAADVLRPVWESLDHRDGFVSIEVMPDLAHDTEATLEQARSYWRRVDRPNVMIKIPGTDEGAPAIERAIAEGINVNVTLLFSVDAYTRVAEAYIRGLERRADAGESLDVHSVASFFVSRVDTEVDRRLADCGHEELAGSAALANARAAYRRYEEIFGGERFAALRAAGAPVQRPLWASTSVKNSAYRDTMYVEGLAGPDTVNTMPMPTLLATVDHGEIPSSDSVRGDPEPALAKLAAAGIDIDDVTAKLLRDGIAAFAKAMDDLVAGVGARRDAVLTGRPKTIDASIPEPLSGAIAQRVARAERERVARRVWQRDATLWGGPGVAEIDDRLGWLTIADVMLERLDELHALRAECRAARLDTAVLLGMGGSSLGPEVLRQAFGGSAGNDELELHVLDTTDPDAVLALQDSIDLASTLFVVSSKSGATVETLSHYAYFRGRVEEAVGAPASGGHFVAVTDGGTGLDELATRDGFRRVYRNEPTIGGRYSVLSHFGMVPAALAGAPVERLLHGAEVAEQGCNSYDHTSENSGLWLGLAVGELARRGRDKLTFVVPDSIAALGLWLEQLVAESTGKHGRGILPVAGEPLGEPGDYGDDRVFAHLRDADDPDDDVDARMRALAAAGQPVITIDVHGREDLGRIFFFAEFAVAVAGWVLEINPFDQPNVQEAKDMTASVLEDFASGGELPAIDEASDDDLRALLDRAEPPHYVAVLAYVPSDGAFDAAAARLRAAIRARTRAATTFGYGPRFQHSTGQLHKGGAPVGAFIQIIHDPARDAEIPGAGYGYATLEAAQSAGEMQTLQAHRLPVARVRLDGDLAAALDGLRERIEGLG